MSLATVSGSLVTAGATRRGAILDGGSALDVVELRVRELPVVVVISIVGLLLLALILIITGCGPPS